MFAKVFTQILDSSLAEDYLVRLVFEDFLKLCDVNGVVDMTPEAISRRTNVPLETVKHGIKELESPDHKSRTRKHEGRRIIRLDEHREWGWIIVNHQLYRDIKTSEDRRTALRPTVDTGYVYYALSPILGRVKIGFSMNPWARIKELRGATTDIYVAATEKGTLKLEQLRHSEFDEFHYDREWFVFSGKLKDFVHSLGICEPLHSSQLRSNDVATTTASVSASVLTSSFQSSSGEMETVKMKVPTLEEVLFFCDKSGIPAADGEWFFWKCDGCGWTNGGKPIRKWSSTLISWKTAGYLPSQKPITGSGGAAHKPQETLLDKELRAIKRRTESL